MTSTRHHRGARRALRHLTTTTAHARRAFSPADLRQLEAAVREGERRHRGEVRIVIEASLPVRDAWAGVTPRQRARTLFGLLEVWNTHEHVGVLLYLNLADHAVEILADRGSPLASSRTRGAPSARPSRTVSPRASPSGRYSKRSDRSTRCSPHISRLTARRAPTNSPTSRSCSDGAAGRLPGHRPSSPGDVSSLQPFRAPFRGPGRQ